MNLLRRINDAVAKVELGLLIFIVLTMVILAFIQVLLRNVFDQGILWGDTFLRHLVLWVGFIGASLATRDEKHIDIDILTRFLPVRAKSVVRIITNVFAGIICFILGKAGLTFVLQEIEFGTILFNDIPAWYFEIIIPVGFALMGIRFFCLSLELTIKWVRPEGGKK
ncbi:MAG: TRAP transporter small permease [Calditrichaceae bacterium]